MNEAALLTEVLDEATDGSSRRYRGPLTLIHGLFWLDGHGRPSWRV